MAEHFARGEHGGAKRPLGQEADRLSIRGVLWTGAGLALLVLFAVVMMRGTFRALAPWMKPAETVGTRPQPRRDALAEPPLDPDQPAELRELRRQEEDVLSTFGWIDKERGVARVPIERAIDLFAEGVRPGGESPAPAEPPTPAAPPRQPPAALPNEEAVP
ncbi:MAG: hypothetical protein WD069_16945 [Planctomycetales bacterium]